MSTNKPFIKVYKPFASSNLTCIMGHVLRSPAKKRERITRNPLKNMLEMIRRYRVKGLENVEVKLTIGAIEMHTRTGKDGYFEFLVDLQTETGEFDILLPDFKVSQTGEVTVTNPDTVVVTDIDDTVLVSHSTSLFKKLYLLLTKNYQRRKAFEGIVQLYSDLIGQSGKLFYVSSSEWNLYDFLNDFMSFNQLPEGVFLLQNIKTGLLDLFKSGGGSHQHKEDKIRRLMNAYPNASFVLIGDSGQKDPDIYEALSLLFPERITKVFIRDVRKSKRSRLVLLEHKLQEVGVELEVLSK